MTFDKVLRLLEREMEADDPWRLNANPFEQERHAHLLRLCLAEGAVGNALEVGCAAGVFTAKLAPHCQQLVAIDVLPRAITRARERAQWPHIAWHISDVRDLDATKSFDLIVVAEVLYYLEHTGQMGDAIEKLTRMLAPSGRLVFGSARDASCQRWGHPAGAETMLDVLNEHLVETERVQCRGASIDEDCLIASFRTKSNLPD
ncbi:SAM-dependent methyltransferase (plasmid) [Bradyrhizobium sp. 62B]|uniref:SAM-dependent methyltransferase n=1 Tax=Bradyrhizobium sp. 62B TaxID=2898442 RepID=UPI002557F5F0|nr:SAM-dependent methyltransferase [Bradyrhizobium sp. 62B]